MLSLVQFSNDLIEHKRYALKENIASPLRDKKHNMMMDIIKC